MLRDGRSKWGRMGRDGNTVASTGSEDRGRCSGRIACALPESSTKAQARRELCLSLKASTILDSTLPRVEVFFGAVPLSIYCVISVYVAVHT
jgi:hypothetical protein